MTDRSKQGDLVGMFDRREFPLDRQKASSTLAKLSVAVIGPPVVIIWLLSYYGIAVAVGIVSLYLLYPQLTKYVRLLFTGQALILGDEGLFDRTFPLGFVPWPRIRGARLTESKNHKIVELELRDEEAFKEEFIQRTWLYRPIRQRNFESGRVGFWIDTHWIDAPPGQVLQAIRARAKAAA